MKDFFYQILLKAFTVLVTRLSPSRRDAVLHKLSKLAYRLNIRHRKIIHTNLDFAFGNELNASQKDEITRNVYRNFIFYLAHFVRRSTISQEAIMQEVSFHDENIVYRAKQTGRPLIFITAHYGNWELCGPLIGARYLPITAVGKKLKSAAISKQLFENRRLGDVDVLESRGAIKGLMKALKAGRALGLVVDQNTRKKESVVVEFFGRRARHIDSAARLARRTGALIIPVFIDSDDGTRFHMRFYEPIDTAKSEDAEKDIFDSVQAQASITEAVIRRKPDEYFWFHKRFKAEYPQLYK
ncbi:lipid A biosynthesis lauroyl acyltransferase [Desulfurispira natronophila]|uniref:KDO2-lipid IV(A) lauroyltransferase n=1 Tax=Desulfurispira natronophila TaxID=682562 RepID=A0A7W8DG79_9BACT|nr:KDO2-lipid IV(A) lauroyltransferase [Desulfurispira natronophila]